MMGPNARRRANARWRADSDNQLVVFETEDHCTRQHIKDQGGLQMASDDTLARDDKIDSLFVDTSGLGHAGERALTQDQMCDTLAELVAEHGPVVAGVTEMGQFQAYVGIWPREEA